MQIKLTAMFLAFTLLCCEDTRGQAGMACNPDGTCDSSRLECVNGSEILGAPIWRPYCRVKEIVK